jgi:hypothetical protein
VIFLRVSNRKQTLLLGSGWIDALQRFGSLLFQLRMRQGFAREHALTFGSVVDKDRHDDGSLLQIGLGEPLVSVHVCVCAATLVIARILKELKTRETDLTEGDMIGGSRVAQSRQW